MILSRVRIGLRDAGHDSLTPVLGYFTLPRRICQNNSPTRYLLEMTVFFQQLPGRAWQSTKPAGPGTASGRNEPTRMAWAMEITSGLTAPRRPSTLLLGLQIVIVLLKEAFDLIDVIEQPHPLFFVKSYGKSSQAVDRETALFTDLQTQLAGFALINLFFQRSVFSFQPGQFLFRGFFRHNPSLRHWNSVALDAARRPTSTIVDDISFCVGKTVEAPGMEKFLHTQALRAGQRGSHTFSPLDPPQQVRL
jgi:hypothetical protein